MNEQDLKKFVGNKIRVERKRKRMSQKELGEKIGVKHNTISSYENATNAPEQDSLFKIARALDIKVDDLFPSNEEKSEDELERVLSMTKDLSISDISLLKSLIEKSLSLDKEEREKFFDSIRFTVEYHDRLKSKD
ncbi:MAG: helix-turn-helix transcriptional regulator [Candidatus Paceibacterota bacterium]